MISTIYTNNDIGATLSSVTEIETKPLPQRFPEELVSSALFLLKRLGMTAKERSFAAYNEAGLHPYHHAILAVLDEGSLATRAQSPTRSATTRASSSGSSTSSRTPASSSAAATPLTGDASSSE